MAVARPEGAPYMPLKLKSIFMDYQLRQTEWAQAVRQFNGAPLSKPAASGILNWGNWPVNTPRHSIETQTRDWLLAKGVPQDVVAAAFETEDDGRDKPRRGQPPYAKHRDAVGGVQLTETETESFHVEPEMLSPQARRAFKLFADPFNTDPKSADDVFRGPDQEYALESIRDAVTNQRFMALVGESGAGKTTLWDTWKDRIAREKLPVRLIQPMVPDKKRLTASGILEAIVRDLNPGATLRMRIEGLTRQASDLLAESAAADQLNCLVFEEAHDLTIVALKQLKRFHEIKSGWKRTLSIVLIGQPELLSKLGEHATGEAREVARRLEIVTLLPLDGEVQPYVTHKLARAGAKAADLFADDAWGAIRLRLQGNVQRGRAMEKVSMAYPLLVNNLLVKALNLAAELGAPKVDANIVREA